MIISFFNHNENANSVLDLIYRDDSAPYRQILYYKTSLQLIKYKEELHGIIIPGNINESIDYAPEELVKHIRLLNDLKISTLPIVITNADKIIDDFEPYLFLGLEPFSNEKDVSFDGLIKLTEEELNNITMHLGNKDDDISKHEISNQWGAYRLIRQIDLLDNNNHSPFVEKSHTDISESLFFRKLLFRELEEENFEISKNDKVTFKSRLKKLRDSIKKIAIIDDEIDKWGDAYKALFNSVEIDYFDQIEDKFHTEYSKQYDLIILDLRLKEKAQNNESDQLNIENLSGMLVLDEIKNADPTVPVIMCTASNKAWSHDAAISKGADGFWTKESPTVSVGMDYSFHNTFDLINVCVFAIEWSKKVKPLFSKMNSIRVKIERIDHSIADSINLKYKLLASNLLREPNQFIEKAFKNSLVFPFLTVWSIGNDILSLVTNEETEDGKEYVECDFKDETTIIFYKQDNKYFIDEGLKNLIVGQNTYTGTPIFFGGAKPDVYYDEKVIMKYLLFKTFGKHYKEKRMKLERFRKIRNHIDIIHGYTQSRNRVNSSEIEFSDLYDLLSIYHGIIMNIK